MVRTLALDHSAAEAAGLGAGLLGEAMSALFTAPLEDPRSR